MGNAVSLLRPEGQGGFVIICDHASNHVPADLRFLGLPPSDLARHIAWDIGAKEVAIMLSEHLDAPAIFSGVSRLVIDCNRHPDAHDLIPEISDGTLIPGNQGLSEAERDRRIKRWFNPYHQAVESVLAAQIALGRTPMVLSIHSMTMNMGGCLRPWQIALSSHHDRRFVEPMLSALRLSGDVTVGDNQPYDLDPEVDYSIPHHAMRRNLPYLQVEFRQDEVLDPLGAESWSQRFAIALAKVYEQ